MFLERVLFAILIPYCIVEVNTSAELRNGETSKILSRQRRYVAFPEGSSFSCAGCMTVGVIGQPAPISNPGVFSFGLNWGIAYELPNETQVARAFRKYNRVRKPVAQRRNRRDLYEKLETIIDTMGYNGRDCVLKTLCETTQRIAPKGSNMIEEMFRTLFTLPMTKMISSEPMEHAIYDSAHRLGHLMENCDKLYHRCPLSLVDMVQGYYNAPAPKMDISANPWALFSSSFG